jgi:hypothetical protein
MFVERKIFSREMRYHTGFLILALAWSLDYFFADGVGTNFRVSNALLIILYIGMAYTAISFIALELFSKDRGQAIQVRPALITQLFCILAYGLLPHLYYALGILQDRGADYYLIGLLITLVVYGSYASVLFEEKSNQPVTS